MGGKKEERKEKSQAAVGIRQILVRSVDIRVSGNVVECG